MLLEHAQQMVPKIQQQLVHVEDPLHVAMWTDNERNAFSSSLTLLAARCDLLVAWGYT